MAQNEVLLGAAGARQGKVIFQNGKLRLQAGTAPAWTDYLTVDSNGLITLPTATALASALKIGAWHNFYDDSGTLKYYIGTGLSHTNGTVGPVWYDTNSTSVFLASISSAGLVLGLTMANGQRRNFKKVTGTKTTNSGTGTETVSVPIALGAKNVSVTIRVTTILAGAGLTTFSVGHQNGGPATDLDAWGSGIDIAANTTTDVRNFTLIPPLMTATTFDLTFTAAAGVFSSGVIRYTVSYDDETAATS